MNKLIVSMTRLSAAVTLFAVDQIEKSVNVMNGGGEGMTKAVEGIETTLNSLTDILADKMDEKKKTTLKSVTRATEETVKRTLDSVDVMVPREAFDGTTQLVERTRDVAAAWIGKAFEKATDGLQPTPAMLSMISKVLPTMTRAISLGIPGRDSEVAWRTAKNTAEIIQLVVNVSTVLPPHGTYKPLGGLVDKCYDMGTFPSVWSVEGLGHYYGDTFFERNITPENILTDPELESIPAKSMTMLHAGIGLSFAQQHLTKITAKSPAAEIKKTVKHIIALDKNNSRKGYAGCAIESLGLVARNFHGLPMMLAVADALEALEPELLGYLWRGAGRAAYFSAPNFIPGWKTPWRAVQMCREEPPHDMGRRNMLAGFAWAATVVNMRHPIVMETILKYHGTEFSETDAFSNGCMSSMVMRYDTSPDDPNIDHFVKYHLSSSDHKLHQQWNHLVKEPCERAIHTVHPVLKETKHLEEVFHYQDLDALVERLKKHPKGKGAKDE